MMALPEIKAGECPRVQRLNRLALQPVEFSAQPHDPGGAESARADGHVSAPAATPTIARTAPCRDNNVAQVRPVVFRLIDCQRAAAWHVQVPDTVNEAVESLNARAYSVLQGPVSMTGTLNIAIARQSASLDSVAATE